jgi:pyrroloquinoline quinone biosynthesis protein E
MKSESPVVRYRPLGLLAELTHRCPLRCPYCSNPASWRGGDELSTDVWLRVLREASGLGVLHALFSGGEPLLRKDLARLVAGARESELYTNLITSAAGLTRGRLEELKSAGLESVQISLQAHEAGEADRIAGRSVHAHKLEACRWVREAGLPLTLNVVLHRANVDGVEELVELALRLGAQRLELANTQFYGWALRNRDALLPTRAQIQEAARVAANARVRHLGTLEILYVLPDYFGDRPKPCMNGWGRRYLTVDPGGDVLPCPTARSIPSLAFENVRQRSLGEIWEQSEAFNRFRGTQWMPEPCRSCPEREIDFGGCRCQAAILTGDPTQTDPSCGLAPGRPALAEILANNERSGSERSPAADPGVPYEYRRNPPTLRIMDRTEAP